MLFFLKQTFCDTCVFGDSGEKGQGARLKVPKWDLVLFFGPLATWRDRKIEHGKVAEVHFVF